MLYHVPDRPRAFAEISRVLRPNGVLVAATNGAKHLSEIHRWERTYLGGRNLLGKRAFSLEDGHDQLQQFFGQVSLAPYPDSLQVTEVEPILAYIRSSVAASDAQGEGWEKLEAELERQLTTNQAIRITKETGLFVAKARVAGGSVVG